MWDFVNAFISFTFAACIVFALGISEISFSVMMIYEYGMLAGWWWQGFLPLYWTHFLFCSMDKFFPSDSHSFDWNVANSMLVAAENLQIPLWMRKNQISFLKRHYFFSSVDYFDGADRNPRAKNHHHSCKVLRFPHSHHPLSILQIKYKYKYIYNTTKSQIW